jgi:hypothetical protein
VILGDYVLSRNLMASTILQSLEAESKTLGRLYILRQAHIERNKKAWVRGFTRSHGIYGTDISIGTTYLPPSLSVLSLDSIELVDLGNVGS